MICPKCGRNIEGSHCPYCEAPRIDDNTDEYIRRKTAYEDSLKDDEGTGEEKPLSRKFTRKHVIATLIVIGAALTAALVTTHLPRIYDGRLYTESGGLVYEITGKDGLSQVQGRIYSTDGKSVFAQVREPEQISATEGAGLKGYAASKNGEFFALAALEDDGGAQKYNLYAWDKNGTCSTAVSTEDVISLKDVTDSGEIIYTTAPVLNDQWFTGDISLHVYKITGPADGALTGETMRVSDSVQKFYVYEHTKSLICLDENGALFSCPDYDSSRSILISENVSAVLAEEAAENNFFSKAAAGTNISLDADMICYLSEGVWRMTDTKGRISLTLGAAGEDAEFIYDNSDRIVYKKEGSDLSRSIVTDEGLKGWESVGRVLGSMIWDADKSTLIYEDADGSLRRVRSLESTVIAENVKSGSLKKIQNGGGYLFEGADGLYISRDFRATPSLVSGDIAGEIQSIAEYKGEVYVQAGGRLYVIDGGSHVTGLEACEGLYVVG